MYLFIFTLKNYNSVPFYFIVYFFIFFHFFFIKIFYAFSVPKNIELRGKLFLHVCEKNVKYKQYIVYII